MGGEVVVARCALRGCGIDDEGEFGVAVAAPKRRGGRTR